MHLHVHTHIGQICLASLAVSHWPQYLKRILRKSAIHNQIHKSPSNRLETNTLFSSYLQSSDSVRRHIGMGYNSHWLNYLKDNYNVDKTYPQIVSYSILYLNPSSHPCQPSYKQYYLFEHILTHKRWSYWERPF